MNTSKKALLLLLVASLFLMGNEGCEAQPEWANYVVWVDRVEGGRSSWFCSGISGTKKCLSCSQPEGAFTINAKRGEEIEWRPI